MGNKNKFNTPGFTIVELLIVIVVIGILAAITIVAFNGIQQRAKNTKSINATTAWIKAIKMYNVDTGNWPSSSCLGATTTYVGENSQCWDGTSWTVTPTFLTSMQPYMKDTPEPDTTNLHNTGETGSPKRGAFFYNTATEKLIYMMLSNTSSCPDIGSTFRSRGTYGNGSACVYRID